MDWETLYCPHEACSYHGIPFSQGRLVKNGSYRGHKQALCKACGCSVSLRYGTAYLGLESASTLVEMAVCALAEGNSLRATARIIQIDKDTACDWLNRAAQHCRLVMLFHWRNLHISECQLDELWSFVHTKEENLLSAQHGCERYGDAWVWLAFAPVCRCVLAFVVGKRTQANANLLLDRSAYVTDDQLPFFTSDQLPQYRNALVHTYGAWQQPPRQGKRGPHPMPRRLPRTDLLYAQVVKVREQGRLVDVSTKIVFGTPEAIAAKIAASPVSHTINTSFIERDNLSQRQSNRRLTRRTNSFAKELSGLEKQLWLSLAYYHFILPHQSLRTTLPTPEPTRGSGSPRRRAPKTPAMAAGLTDHVWTVADLLSYRVPLYFHEHLPKINHLFPHLR